MSEASPLPHTLRGIARAPRKIWHSTPRVAVRFPSEMSFDAVPEALVLVCNTHGPAPWVSCMTARAGRSKSRRWNDNCTGRRCSAEPAASSKEAAAEARQMEKKRKKAENNASYRAKVKDAGGLGGYREQRALAAEEARSKLTAGDAELEAMLMKRKRQRAEGDKLRHAKVKAVGGQDAYRERRALAAEEARSKLTAEEAVLEEAKQMEKKRKHAGYDKSRHAKLKLISPLAQEKRLLEQEQRALAAEEDRAFSLSRPKQTAEEAELEERARAIGLERPRCNVLKRPCTTVAGALEARMLLSEHVR